MANQRVDSSGIDVLGHRTEVNKLLRYANQDGATAAEFLEQVVRQGSADMRRAAVRALATIDAPRAERLVLAELAALRRRRPPKRDLAAVVSCLLEIRSDAAMDRVLDLAIDHPTAPEVAIPIPIADAEVDVVVMLFARLAARSGSLDGDRLDRVLDRLDAPRVLAARTLPDELRRRLAIALVRTPGISDATRARAAEVLLESADDHSLAVIREGTSAVPFKLRARALLAGDPRRAFDELAPTFRVDPLARDAVLQFLDQRADPRWAQEVLALVDEHPAGVTSVLGRIGAGDELCDLAVRPTLDEIARCALYALRQVGDSRASALLLWWLETPEGHERAPMLLTALGECGDLAALSALEAKLPEAGARHPFYRHAIDAIRARRDGAVTTASPSR